MTGRTGSAEHLQEDRMRKFTRQISIKLTPEEARTVREMCTHGEYRISAGELVRKLLASEAKRRQIGRQSTS